MLFHQFKLHFAVAGSNIIKTTFENKIDRQKASGTWNNVTYNLWKNHRIILKQNIKKCYSVIIFNVIICILK